MKLDINYSESFEGRHNGLDDKDIKEMLETVGAESLEQLIDETIPANIRLKENLNLQ
jgi:glycine dehydrogenase